MTSQNHRIDSEGMTDLPDLVLEQGTKRFHHPQFHAFGQSARRRTARREREYAEALDFVRALAAEGWEIGAPTVSHRVLTHDDVARIEREVRSCRDAIEAQAAEPSAASDAALAEELGDVYLQVILHAQLAAERGAFDLTDVQERLAKKIVRRHPHVFGDATAETSREVQRAWESVKAGERAASGGATTKGASALSGVSRGLPALSASRELQDRASAMGYDWPTLEGVREKLAEELRELDEALEAAGNPDSITARGATSPAALAAAQDELGDVMAVLPALTAAVKQAKGT